MSDQMCRTLPASMLAAPCAKCGEYPKTGEYVHIVDASPEAATFYCHSCCPRCVLHIGSMFVPEGRS